MAKKVLSSNENYVNGMNYLKDLKYKKALESFLKGASEGDAESNYQVAQIYEKARGVERNLEFANKYYTDASDLGHKLSTGIIKSRKITKTYAILNGYTILDLVFLSESKLGIYAIDNKYNYEEYDKNGSKPLKGRLAIYDFNEIKYSSKEMKKIDIISGLFTIPSLAAYDENTVTVVDRASNVFTTSMDGSGHFENNVIDNHGIQLLKNIDGTIYGLNSDGLLFKKESSDKWEIDKSIKENDFIKSLNNVNIKSFDAFASNDIYIVGDGNLTLHFDGKKWSKFNVTTEEVNWTKVYCGMNGSVYILGSNGEFVKGNINTWEYTQVINDQPITDIAVFQNEVYVISDRTLFTLDKKLNLTKVTNDYFFGHWKYDKLICNENKLIVYRIPTTFQESMLIFDGEAWSNFDI